MSVLTLLSLSC